MRRKVRPAGIKSVDGDDREKPAEIGRAGGGRDAPNPGHLVLGHPALTAFYQKPRGLQTTFI
jgi:hypothetical protein